MPRQSDKRERLVAAGSAVFYEQGFRGTSLADIAARADVPLGNVYYYFKTKDDLARAVIAQRRQDIEDRAADIEAKFPSPRKRLQEFVRRAGAARERVATFGCPYGTLAQELSKGEGPLAAEVAELLRLQTKWAQAQFAALGQSSSVAKKSALELVAAMQGASLLTHALGDASIMKSRFAAIGRSLASDAAQ